MSRNPSGVPILPRVEGSPREIFLAGALLFPPFLLQQDIVIRAVLTVLFMTLTALAGRRVRLWQALAVTAGIVVFNLIIPTGRVLASPLGLPITEAALRSGLMKATAMTGLIFLSQFSIRASLRLPGRAGGLVGRSLYYFEAIMAERREIDRRHLIGSLDAILLSLGDPGPAAEEHVPVPPARRPEEKGSRAGGRAVLIAIVVLNWAVFFVTLAHPRPFWGA